MTAPERRTLFTDEGSVRWRRLHEEQAHMLCQLIQDTGFSPEKIPEAELYAGMAPHILCRAQR